MGVSASRMREAFTSGLYIWQDTDKLEIVQKIPRAERGAWNPAPLMPILLQSGVNFP